MVTVGQPRGFSGHIKELLRMVSVLVSMTVSQVLSNRMVHEHPGKAYCSVDSV